MRAADFGSTLARAATAEVRRAGVQGVLAGALALAMVLLAAWWLVPVPASLGAARVPAGSVAWLPPIGDGLPVHWLQGADAGALERLPRERRSVQIALLRDDRPISAGRALLFLPAAAGVPEVFVNGANVSPEVTLGEPYLASPRMRPVRIAIPATSFRPGANRIDAVFSGIDGPVLMAPPLLGDEARIGSAAATAVAWIGPLRRVAVTMSLLAAALALIAAIVSASRGWFLGLAAAAAAIGCRMLLATASVPGIPAAWRWPLDHLLLAAASVTLVCAVLNRPVRRSGMRGLRLRQPAAIALTAITAAALVVAVRDVFEPWSGLWLARLDAVHGVSVIVLTGVLALVSAWVGGRDGARLANNYLNLARTARLQRIHLAQTRGELKQQLRRTALLEERQRLARDVHDGVGGALASLLARVRTRRIDIAQIETELVGGLSDLRLIMDSMDAAGESLTAALAVFRARIGPQLEQAGMELHWQQPDELGAAADDPHWVLHVYRLLQEAANNAMRHAQARGLWIRIDPLDAHRLRIEVVDDGVGMPAPPRSSTGHGLANMAWRARQLGGQLQVEPATAQGGTRIRVEIAMPAAGLDQPRDEIRPS